MRAARVLTVLPLLTSCAASALAQVAVGGAFVVTGQSARRDEPGTFSPPPGGTAPGVLVFVGRDVAPALALRGEISIPSTLSTTRSSSYRAGTFTDTTQQRDVVASGVLRIRTGRRCCDVVAGAGVVFARTSATSVFVDRDTGRTVTTRRELRRTARPALTLGGDFPIPLRARVALLPTARLHWLARPTLEAPPGIDSRPLGRPASVAFQAGLGFRAEF